MSDRHALRLAIVPRPDSASFAGLEYWLRMEQLTGDDIATADTMAEIVDELYGIEACSPEPTPGEEQPPITWERIMEIAARRLDIEECKRRASGDYTAQAKVVYSHPDDQDHRPEYSVTIGRITSKVMISEEVTKTVTVREQQSVALDVPVPHKAGQKWPGTAKWLGSVFNEVDGAIPPPEIIGVGNVLSWGVAATGTILVKVPTVYELVSIEVPGVPRLGSLAGDSQDTLLRAFWRLQVYELDVRAVSQDTTADGQTLAKLCGWDSYGGDTDGIDGSSGDSTSNGDGVADDTADDGPPLGCLDYDKELASEDYYRQVCCTAPPPNISLPDCLVYAISRPTKSMSDEVKKSYEDDHRGKMSFVAVGPGPEGCGRQFRRQLVRKRNCCDDLAVNLAWDLTKSENLISRGSAMKVLFFGGMRPIVAIRVRGEGFWLDAAYRIKQRAIETQYYYVAVVVYADQTACGYGQLDISDGCTTISWYFQCTAGSWVEINPWDCEARMVAAQWHGTIGVIAGGAVWATSWYQDSRYKIVQRYYRGPGESHDDYAYSYESFDAACAQTDDVDWESLIPQVEADSEFFRVWETYPHLIDIGSVAHLVPWNFYFHGNSLSPSYGNEILYNSNGFFGGEKVKYMSGNKHVCGSALAFGVCTGYRSGITYLPDLAIAQVWEWQC
jgi:hypothetical protein